MIGAKTKPKSLINGFAYHLVEIANLLDIEVATRTLKEAIDAKTSFITYLIANKLIDETQLAAATAEYYGLPFFDLDDYKPDCIPLAFLNMDLVRKRVLLPIYHRKNALYIACTDPLLEGLQEINFTVDKEIRFIIVESTKLLKLIDSILGKKALTEFAESVDVETEKATPGPSVEQLFSDVNSAPVIKFVNGLLFDALEKRASDIHFEYFEDIYRIRFRIDGILHLILEPPISLAQYLIARIKVMANLDITERRVPQDGRISFTMNQQSVDIRVSTCPTLNGEKAVLRLLNPSQNFYTIDKLGLYKDQKLQLEKAIKHTQGLILVTGPTGSGKTATLYSLLAHLNSIEKNILTIEDPVEIPLKGINQVHVNPKAGLTFATVLRAFLRQDPDIIMVGEIRDAETVEVAIRASQTGHLVLSTLHTNNAVETITRLLNLGVAPYNLSGSLLLIMAQRLVRILCPKCKVQEKISHQVLLNEGFKKEEIDTLVMYGPSGCEKCTNGFKGRTGIFEVLTIDTPIANLIMEGKKSLAQLNITVNKNLISLRECGLQKVREGITSLGELNRVFY